MEGARTESRNEQDVGWVCMSGQGGIQVGKAFRADWGCGGMGLHHGGL